MAPEVVRDAWLAAYDNANRWTTGGQPATITKQVVRERIARFINADPSEVALTRNTTEGITGFQTRSLYLCDASFRWEAREDQHVVAGKHAFLCAG